MWSCLHMTVPSALETSQIKQSLPVLQEEGGIKGSRGQTMTWDLTCAVWAFCASGGAGNIHVRHPLQNHTFTFLLSPMTGVLSCD